MTDYPDSGIQVIGVPAGEEDAAWQRVRDACASLTDWGEKCLRGGLDGYVRSIAVEPRYICKDFRDLYSHFYSKKFVDRPSRCGRLHFFADPVSSTESMIFQNEELASSYMGYTVVQPVKDRCLGRTMIDPFSLGHAEEEFWCLRTPTRMHLNGARYIVQAYPWMSQSGEATVCAHAALWGICRYLSERYNVYQEVHPYDLIEMMGTARGRRVPYRGMTYSDYCDILAAFGCHPVILTARTDQSDWTQDRDFFYNLYAFVESGFPVLISYRGHAATLVGHTMDTAASLDAPEHGMFYNSFSFLKQFVAMDDNFFPYQLLGFRDDPEDYGRPFSNLPHGASIDSIFAAIVPLPEKAFLPPDKARSLSYRFLSQRQVKPLIEKTLDRIGLRADEPLIARPFLTSSISFKKRKRLCARGQLDGCRDDLARVPIDLHLPHFIWVMEIAPASTYRHRKCIAEVVLDASESEDECEYVYIRIGDRVIREDRLAVVKGAPTQFVQYTHNLGERGT